MSADDGAADLSRFFRATAQNGGDRPRRYEFLRESHYIKSSHRATAHGEHIGERVGGGDLSVSERIVNDRCEEIHGLHECAFAVETINARVIERDRIDENVSISITR